jgi:predicted nucleotidyltransferase
MKSRFRLNQSDREHFLSKIASRLVCKQEIVFAYFYGSAVNNTVVGDIDIAVYFKEYIPTEKQIDISLTLTLELSAELGIPVDVRPLNHTVAGFRFHVTDGRLVFSRDEETRLNFVESTWREYLDYKPLLEQSLADMLE